MFQITYTYARSTKEITEDRSLGKRVAVIGARFAHNLKMSIIYVRI